MKKALSTGLVVLFFTLISGNVTAAFKACPGKGGAGCGKADGTLYFAFFSGGPPADCCIPSKRCCCLFSACPEPFYPVAFLFSSTETVKKFSGPSRFIDPSFALRPAGSILNVPFEGGAFSSVPLYLETLSLLI